MRCEFCGNIIGPGTEKCRYCGAPCAPEDNQSSPMQQDQYNKNSVKQKSNKNNDELRPMSSPDISFLKENQKEAETKSSGCGIVILVIIISITIIILLATIK